MNGDDETQTEARQTSGLRQTEQSNKALSLEHQDEQHGKKSWGQCSHGQ